MISFKCTPPLNGSFVRIASPGPSFSAPYARIARGTPCVIEPRCTGWANACATQFKSRSKKAQEKSLRERALLPPYGQLAGVIVSGAGRGKLVTAPTLNLRPHNELLPGIGVYVSRISVDAGPFLDSITNVGVRPTFGETDLTVETFILNDAAPSQATSARLQFIKRLRNESRFESPEALRRQIGLDVRRAQKFFHLLKTFGHAGPE